MTNEELNFELAKEIKCERENTVRILKLIIIADDRRVALERGYKDSFAWLVQEHKYSPSAARRRVFVAKLLRDVPSIEKMLEDGTVNLTTLAQVQSMIRTQEMKSRQKVPLDTKLQAVVRIEGLNAFDAEQALMDLLPENISNVKRESLVAIDACTGRLSINLSNEALADLKRAKEIFAHAIPDRDSGKIVARSLKELVERHDPLKKTPRASAAYAHRATRLQLYLRENGQCDFIDPMTGHRCEERALLERDHIHPRALGGDDSLANGRMLCRAHNQYMSEKIFGKKIANLWRKQRRI